MKYEFMLEVQLSKGGARDKSRWFDTVCQNRPQSYE
jgi:hypothetical protein